MGNLRAEIKGTKADIESNVQPSQADIYSTVQSFNSSLQSLREEIESGRESSAALSAKLDDLQAAMTSRLDALYELLAGSKFAGDAEPSALFNQAASDWARSHYDSAIAGFQRYLERYPGGEKAPEAVLRIGECEMRLKKPTEANTQFEHFISNYPNHPLIAAALYDKAQILEQSGQASGAAKLYQQILQKYSYRPEADLARDRLKSLQPSASPSGSH